MANDRWDDDEAYRPRRYGNDSDYERNFWRDREYRGRGSADEDRRSRYASLPVFGLDYGRPRRYPDRDRNERQRYAGNRDRDVWGGGERNYGDEWSRRNYGDEWSSRDYGSDWRDTSSGWGRRETGSDWGQRARGERGWWDRTKDEVRSWFGDAEAEHRREADHRGRGPRGYTRSDDRIREDVSDWLMEDSYVDASDIEVLVVAGEVTLTGTVDTRDMKWRAENLAADVMGVKDVHNRLRTRSRQSYGATTATEGMSTSSSQASSAITGSGETNASTTPRH
jgi:osmotically-inducible protein OsmY